MTKARDASAALAKCRDEEDVPICLVSRDGDSVQVAHVRYLHDGWQADPRNGHQRCKAGQRSSQGIHA